LIKIIDLINISPFVLLFLMLSIGFTGSTRYFSRGLRCQEARWGWPSRGILCSMGIRNLNVGG